MSESIDQFIARTNGHSKSLSVWGAVLIFLSVFSFLQAGYGACRGTWVEHLVIGITVLKGCEGTEVMFMLTAAFAAVVMPWRRRLIGLGLGILLVFGLNQIRLVALFYAFRADPSLFDLLHGILAPIALVIAVALYVMYWMGYAAGIPNSDASAAT